MNSKKCSLIQRNRFVHIKEKFFESTKLSSIQTHFFFYCISKKLFSECKLILELFSHERLLENLFQNSPAVKIELKYDHLDRSEN